MSLLSLTLLQVLFISSVAKVPSDDNDDYQHDPFLSRWLQSSNAASRGRTVLTVLYLCILGLCCVAPVLYYIRLSFEERQLHRLRALEAAGLRAALERSQQNRRESKAERSKYTEERRARILQLFAPVQTTLKGEHFFTVQDDNDTQQQQHTAKPAATLPTTLDEETGDLDEDSLRILIPVPGLHVAVPPENLPTRLVPANCAICLSDYRVGAQVVWSSNSACEHVFHLDCIEKWIMKQREGPLCPCCRRDFCVDPYDTEDVETAHGQVEMIEPVD